jgi:hypothetical protein
MTKWVGETVPARTRARGLARRRRDEARREVKSMTEEGEAFEAGVKGRRRERRGCVGGRERL